jgi:hypothetical protein
MDYNKYGIGALLLVIAFSAGRFTAPASVQTKQSEHTTTSENENINRNQNTVVTTIETHRPDGTVIKETRKERETTTQTERSKNAQTDKSFSQTAESRPSYHLGVGYQPGVRSFQPEVFSVLIEKRLFSEVYLGVEARSDKQFGLILSLGF